LTDPPTTELHTLSLHDALPISSRRGVSLEHARGGEWKRLMRVLYFSPSYTPHDFRFLSALASTEHEIHYLRLERCSARTDSRPVPPRVRVAEAVFPETVPALGS